jgi:hypothetical protein
VIAPIESDACDHAGAQRSREHRFDQKHKRAIRWRAETLTAPAPIGALASGRFRERAAALIGPDQDVRDVAKDGMSTRRGGRLVKAAGPPRRMT